MAEISAIKSTENHPGPIIKKLKGRPTNQVDEDKRTIVFVLTAPELDRDGESVSPHGVDVSDYLVNPIVAWNHETEKVPVGKMVGKPWVAEIGPGTEYPEVGGDRQEALLGRVQFDTDEFSDQVYGKVRRGFIRGGSISFTPVGKVGRNTNGGNHYENVKLIEFSITPVPSCPRALATNKKSLKANSEGEPAAKPVRKWSVGDRVRVTAGDCKGGRGVITAGPKDGKVTVRLDLGGDCEVPSSQVTYKAGFADDLVGLTKEQLNQMIKPDPKNPNAAIVHYPNGGTAWYPSLATARVRLYADQREQETGDRRKGEVPSSQATYKNLTPGYYYVAEHYGGSGEWYIYESHTNKIMAGPFPTRNAAEAMAHSKASRGTRIKLLHRKASWTTWIMGVSNALGIATGLATGNPVYTIAGSVGLGAALVNAMLDSAYRSGKSPKQAADELESKKSLHRKGSKPVCPSCGGKVKDGRCEDCGKAAIVGKPGPGHDHSAAFERCIDDLKEQGHDAGSAHAICYARGPGKSKGEDKMEQKQIPVAADVRKIKLESPDGEKFKGTIDLAAGRIDCPSVPPETCQALEGHIAASGERKGQTPDGWEWKVKEPDEDDAVGKGVSQDAACKAAKLSLDEVDQIAARFRGVYQSHGGGKHTWEFDSKDTARNFAYAVGVPSVIYDREVVIKEQYIKSYGGRTVRLNRKGTNMRKCWIKNKAAWLLKSDGDYLDDETKDYLMERGLDEVRIEEAEPPAEEGWEEAKDIGAQPPEGKTEEVADDVARRAAELEDKDVPPEEAVEAAMEEEGVPKAMRPAVKSLALRSKAAGGPETDAAAYSDVGKAADGALTPGEEETGKAMGDCMRAKADEGMEVEEAWKSCCAKAAQAGVTQKTLARIKSYAVAKAVSKNGYAAHDPDDVKSRAVKSPAPGAVCRVKASGQVVLCGGWVGKKLKVLKVNSDEGEEPTKALKRKGKWPCVGSASDMSDIGKWEGVNTELTNWYGNMAANSKSLMPALKDVDLTGAEKQEVDGAVDQAFMKAAEELGLEERTLPGDAPAGDLHDEGEKRKQLVEQGEDGWYVTRPDGSKISGPYRSEDEAHAHKSVKADDGVSTAVDVNKADDGGIPTAEDVDKAAEDEGIPTAVQVPKALFKAWLKSVAEGEADKHAPKLRSSIVKRAVKFCLKAIRCKDVNEDEALKRLKADDDGELGDVQRALLAAKALGKKSGWQKRFGGCGATVKTKGGGSGLCSKDFPCRKCVKGLLAKARKADDDEEVKSKAGDSGGGTDELKPDSTMSNVEGSPTAGGTDALKGKTMVHADKNGNWFVTFRKAGGSYGSYGPYPTKGHALAVRKAVLKGGDAGGGTDELTPDASMVNVEGSPTAGGTNEIKGAGGAEAYRQGLLDGKNGKPIASGWLGDKDYERGWNTGKRNRSFEKIAGTGIVEPDEKADDDDDEEKRKNGYGARDEDDTGFQGKRKADGDEDDEKRAKRLLRKLKSGDKDDDIEDKDDDDDEVEKDDDDEEGVKLLRKLTKELEDLKDEQKRLSKKAWQRTLDPALVGSRNGD